MNIKLVTCHFFYYCLLLYYVILYLYTHFVTLYFIVTFWRKHFFKTCILIFYEHCWREPASKECRYPPNPSVVKIVVKVIRFLQNCKRIVMQHVLTSNSSNIFACSAARPGEEPRQRTLNVFKSAIPRRTRRGRLLWLY